MIAEEKLKDKKPWDDSLWMDCLLELMSQYKRQGKVYVNFSEVDALVVEKSKRISEYTIKPLETST